MQVRDEANRLWLKGREEPARLHQRSARLQSDRQAVSRHGGPPSAEHAVSEHRGRQADHAVEQLDSADRDGTYGAGDCSFSGGLVLRRRGGPAAGRDLGRGKWDVESLVNIDQFVEQCERRDLLSGITDVMAANGIAASMRALAEAAANGRSNPLSLYRRIRVRCSIPTEA